MRSEAKDNNGPSSVAAIYRKDGQHKSKKALDPHRTNVLRCLICLSGRSYLYASDGRGLVRHESAVSFQRCYRVVTIRYRDVYIRSEKTKVKIFKFLGLLEKIQFKEKKTMTTHKDPICGMQVEELDAAGQSEYEGKTYYFCSTGCKAKFEADPAEYADE